MEMKILINHFKQIQTALERVEGAEAFLNVKTFILEVRVRERVYTLFPMFITSDNGRTKYVPTLTQDASLFAGWRPYNVGRPTPELGKKKSFKAFLAKLGLRYPASSSTSPSAFDFIVKRDISSFGENIRGPFRSGTDVSLDFPKGDFCEEFIPGEIVKIYFHNTKPLGMEIKPMPIVTGNGRSTVRELANEKFFRRLVPYNLETVWAEVEQMVAYGGGYTLESVLKEGEKVTIDFRYGSPFLSLHETEDISAPLEEKGCDCLAVLGEAIWDALPDVWRETAVYSVDAIRNTEGHLYFLEVNFNTLVHPALYPEMISVLPALPNFREIRYLPTQN